MTASADNPVPVVVANADHIAALSIIRSLGRRGIPVVCVFGRGRFRQYAQIVRASRFISQVFEFDETDHESNLVACLRQVGRALGRKAVLIPPSDQDMIAISAHRDALREHYHLLMPPHDLLLTILNKDRFYPFARDNGLPIPSTFRVDQDPDIDLIAGNIRYPCIVKPPWRDEHWQTVYGNQKVVMSHTARELKDSFHSLYGHFGTLTIQEVIPGDEGNLLCSFTILNERSEPLCMFIANKKRQFPRQFGNSSLVEQVSEPAVEELTARICERLGLVGYASIEFKKDLRDGNYKIIEITPCRFNRQTGLADEAGVCIPHIWYSHVLGRPVEIAPHRAGGKWISEVNELRTFKDYRQAGEYTLGQWLRSYRGVRRCEVFARDDLRPFLRLLPSAIAQRQRSRKATADAAHI